MIQDIYPAVYDNAYVDCVASVTDADKMMCVNARGDVLVKADEENIDFPNVSQVRTACDGEVQLTYLFAMEEDGQKVRFFLAPAVEIEGYEYIACGGFRGIGMSRKPFRYAALVASQLGRWYSAHRFCGRCGHEMVHDDKERMMKCPECGLMEFPKICPCVIVGVLNGDRILVSRYPHSRLTSYALIAGFTEVGETIEECVKREVFEETNIRVKNLKYYKSQPWPLSESLLFGFFCELDGDDEIVLKDGELAMAKWATVDEITEGWTDFALTNEMLMKFKNDMTKYGKLMGV